MTTHTKSASVWLSGATDINQDLDLLAANTPAPFTLAHIAVFQISTEQVMNCSNQQLSQLFSVLKAHGIALCVSGLMLPGTVNGPGWGVEGYSAPGTMGAVAQRIASLGGNLQYVAMDEPLYYGHEYEGPYAAQASIAEVAQQVAISVAEIKAVFPNVQIGDGEPVPNTTDIAQWMSSYQAATGSPLAFFDADVNWYSSGWQAGLESVEQTVQSAGVKFGLFYDGDADAQTGASWNAQAESRIAAVAADPQLSPDIAYISSWDTQPATLGPETSLDALTHLAVQYSKISALFSSGTATSAGALAISGTAPASNVEVLGFADSVSALGITAPAAAAGATYVALLTDAAGELSATQLGGATVSGSGTSSLRLQGSLAAVNAELATLTYSAASAGNDTIQVSFLSDLGGSVQLSVAVSAEAPLPVNPSSLSISTEFADVYGTVPTSAQLSALTQAPTQAWQSLAAAAQTEIGRLYLEVLGRAPDSSGLAGFTASLMKGTPLSAIRQEFATSGEIQTRLETAYSDVYGTPLTQAQLASAESVLSSGSTLQQVEAPWYAQALTEVTQQVYEAVQGRDPDPAEAAAAASALLGGQRLSTLRSNAAVSAESQDRLTNLYKNLFGYAPPPSELSSLENSLGSGAATIQAVTASLTQHAAATTPSLTGIAEIQSTAAGNRLLPLATSALTDTDPNELVTATVSVAQGAGILADSAGTLAQAGTAWSMTGSASAVQAALQGLSFTPAAAGASELYLTARDGTGHAVFMPLIVTATGGATGPALTAVAPPSSLAVAGFADPLTGLAIAAGASDAGSTFSAVLMAQGGTLSAAQAGAATVTGNGSASLTIHGSLADVNAVLAGVSYTGATGAIQVTYSDALGNTAQAAIPVTGENLVSIQMPPLTIAAVFQNVTGRAPTTAELAALQAAATSTTATQAEQGLVAEAESQVGRLYADVLGRAPDIAGLSGFTAELIGGTPLSALRKTFAFCSEEQNRLQTAYTDVYGTPLTAAQLTAAETGLASGSTLQQVEAPWSLQAQAGVSQLYINVLGRNADPAGLASAVNSLLTGRSLSALRQVFAASAECQTKLTGIYQSLFGYTPNQSVLSSLENRLASGVTLQSVTASLQAQAATTAPSAGGVIGAQTISIGRTALPFAAATVSDTDLNETMTAKVSVVSGILADKAGTVAPGGTVWRMSGSASAVQSALQSLSFTPSSSSLTATATLTLSDGTRHTANAVTAITLETLGSPTEMAFAQAPSAAGGLPDVVVPASYQQETVIQGFNPAADIVQISKAVLPGWSAAASHMSAGPAGAVIALGHGGSIVFEGIPVKSLQASDFHFV